MKRGKDIAVEFPGLYLVHHNLPGKQVSRHSHDEHLVFLPLQGEIRVFLDSGELSAGPGRVIYLPPHTEHAFDSSSQLGERLIALVSEKRWGKAAPPPRGACVLPASQLGKELLFFLVLHPKTKHAAPLIDTFLIAVSESAETVGNEIDLDQAESRVRDPRLRRVLALFAERVETPPSMDEAAKAAGLSVRNLSRLFAGEMGASPKQVLTRYRIERAREVLLSGQGNVTEASLAAGYQSLAQFIRTFRQVTGQLPSEVLRHGSARK